MSAFLFSAFGSGLVTVGIAYYHGLTLEQAAPYATVAALLLGVVAWGIESEIDGRRRKKLAEFEQQQFEKLMRSSTPPDTRSKERGHGG